MVTSFLAPLYAAGRLRRLRAAFSRLRAAAMRLEISPAVRRYAGDIPQAKQAAARRARRGGGAPRCIESRCRVSGTAAKLRSGSRPSGGMTYTVSADESLEIPEGRMASESSGNAAARPALVATYGLAALQRRFDLGVAEVAPGYARQRCGSCTKDAQPYITCVGYVTVSVIRQRLAYKLWAAFGSRKAANTN
jgi:hypothetical protein